MEHTGRSSLPTDAIRVPNCAKNHSRAPLRRVAPIRRHSDAKRTCRRTRGTEANDPFVWSGRASQEVFVEVAVSGLASMYPASDWSVLCSGPSWISARVRPHYQTGLSGPNGSPVLARAGKTDPPSRLILSQTSAG